MFCQKCGKEKPDKVDFCAECGSQMSVSTHNNSLKGINEKLKAGIDSAKSFANEKAKNINININEKHKEQIESAKSFASESLNKLPIPEKFKTPKMLAIGIVTIIFLLIFVGLFNLTPSLEKVLDNRQGEEAIAYIQDAISEYGVNASDYENTTVMMTAASYGYTDVVEALINEGADYNAEDDNYQTSLSYAARNGYIDTVKVLLKQKKINIDAINGRAIRNASANGWYDVVELLIKEGADVNTEPDSGETALHNAFWEDYPEIALLLIENGADFSYYMSRAIDKQWFDVLELCMKKLKKTDLSEKHHALDSSLISAALKGYIEIAEKLIKEGADVNGLKMSQNTPLNAAIDNENVEIVKLLIDAGADINAMDNYGNRTLYDAANNNNTEIAKLLINAGVDIDAVSAGDNTPLHGAAANDNVEMTKLLIDAGANVNTVNNIDNTPLHVAVENDNTEIAKLLINAGANVSAVNLSDRPYERTTDEIKQMLRDAGAKE